MYHRLQNLGHDVCNCVRWKSQFYESQRDPTVSPSNDDSYWCALTQRVLGPDGRVVDLENCQPGRACFKEPF